MGDYKVGYRKPPEHTRFKKGQSGNPRGRPRRAGASDVAAVLSEPIPVRSGNSVRMMDPFEVLVRGLVRRAVKHHDVKAALEFLKLCEHYGVIAPPPAAQACRVITVPWQELNRMAASMRPALPRSAQVAEGPNKEETRDDG